MNLERRYDIAVLAAHDLQHRINTPVPTFDGGWVVSFDDLPKVVVLDSNLKEIEHLDLGAQTEQHCRSCVALSPGGQFFAISTRTQLRITDSRGKLLHALEHPPWQSFTGSACGFDQQGRLWHVQPGDEPGTDDRLKVMDPASGTTLARRVIPNEVGHFDLLLCPDHQGVLIDIGCGQDGSFLVLARLSSSRLSLKPFPFDDRIFTGGFAPGWQEFVTGPQHGDALNIHAYPGGQVIATLEGEAVFGGEDLGSEYPDEVGYHSLFLDADHILCDTRFGRMVVIRRSDMKVLGTLWPEGFRFAPYGASGREVQEEAVSDYWSGLASFHSAGPGRLLTVYEGGRLELVDVSSVLGQG